MKLRTKIVICLILIGLGLWMVSGYQYGYTDVKTDSKIILTSKSLIWGIEDNCELRSRYPTFEETLLQEYKYKGSGCLNG